MSEKPAEGQDRDQVLKEVQSWWEVASIAQFVSLFRESFNLPEIEIEELEQWFIDYKMNGSSKELKDLIFALLRTVTVGKSVNEENWESHLQKLVSRKWPKDKENPFPKGVSFSDLSLRTKVEIIYALCHYCFDKNDIETIMKSMNAEALRVQKLGMDDIGNTYWYFYGTRLYKEEYVVKSSWDEEWKNEKEKSLKKRGRGRPRKIVLKSDGESDGFEDLEERRNNGYMNANEKSRWSVVCDTMEEWVNFAEKFKSSKSKNEMALFHVIQMNFLPTLSQIYEEKEKKLQQKIRELMPVRERIVTRRETRRQRGELQQSPMNGYEISDEAHKLHLQRDRARRLEERNKRATEFQSLEEQKQKRARYDHFASEESMLDAQADDYNKVAFSRPEFDRSDFQADSELETQLDLQTQMEKLLSNVKLHKDAWPFLFPVREEQAPGYFDIIKEPVDLSLIETKLYDGHYETVGELDADFSKMVANCQLYNGENHVYSKMAHALWKTFRRGVSKILDSLPEEVLNAADDEQSTSTNSSSPRGRARKPKDGRKRRKRGMDPLEMLAHASEIAVQTANRSQQPYDGHSSPAGSENSFSSLKVTSVSSHPPSLMEEFSSEVTNEGSSGDTFDSSSSYVSQEIVDKTSSSPREANYVNNLAQNFSNFVEKNSHKEFNILSNNEIASSEGKSHSVGNPENIDHGLDNILGEENMTNFLSNLMYNSENQLDNSIDSNNGCLESTPKPDINKVKKSPTSTNYLGATDFDNNVSFFQDGLTMSSSTNTSAVDTSALNIPLNKNLRVANASASQGDKAKSASISTAGPPKPTFSYRSQAAADELRQNEAGYHLVQKRVENQIQPHLAKPVGRSATTFAPSVTSTLSQVPYQVTAAQAATTQHPQVQESSVIKLNVGSQNSRVMFVPGTMGSVATYQVYAEANPDGAVLSSSPSLPVNPQVPSGQESITVDNQAKSPIQVTSPRTLESIATPPQRISPAVHQGSLNSPSSQSAAFNSPKTTFSMANTSFMPVNSLASQFQSKGSLYPATTVNAYPTSTTSSIQNGQFQGTVIQGPRTVVYQGQPTNIAVGNPNNINAFQQVMFQGSPQQTIQLPNGTRYIIAGANVLGNKGQVLQIQNSQGNQAFGEMSQVVTPSPLIQVAKGNPTPNYQLQSATQSSGQPLSQVQPAQYMNVPMYMLANQTVPQAAPTVQSYQRAQIHMNGPQNR